VYACRHVRLSDQAHTLIELRVHTSCLLTVS
jgi:hypothetical protein